MPPTKLFVGSLPDGTSGDELRALFAAYGDVAESDVIKDYGFVHMTRYEDATAAIAGLNGYRLRGSAISVEESRSTFRQRPGMGGRSTCFRCGQAGHWGKNCMSNGQNGSNGPSRRFNSGGGDSGGFQRRSGPYDRRTAGPPSPAARGYGGGSRRHDSTSYDSRDVYERSSSGGGTSRGDDRYYRNAAVTKRSSRYRDDNDDADEDLRSAPPAYYDRRGGDDYSSGGQYFQRDSRQPPRHYDPYDRRSPPAAPPAYADRSRHYRDERDSYRERSPLARRSERSSYDDRGSGYNSSASVGGGGAGYSSSGYNERRDYESQYRY